MPIYEYRCAACGHEFELLIRSQGEERIAACPKCETRKIERVPSVFSAHAAAASPLPRGGCGRCGDPNGSCPLG
ncbi:MAG: zinc ribbon domain-containing protein [Planctomycetes bacterium]|nr:zinc ribbon domain-containing protein [Planctomycetota bacterium]